MLNSGKEGVGKRTVRRKESLWSRNASWVFDRGVQFLSALGNLRRGLFGYFAADQRPANKLDRSEYRE